MNNPQSAVRRESVADAQLSRQIWSPRQPTGFQLDARPLRPRVPLSENPVAVAVAIDDCTMRLSCGDHAAVNGHARFNHQVCRISLILVGNAHLVRVRGSRFGDLAITIVLYLWIRN